MRTHRKRPLCIGLFLTVAVSICAAQPSARPAVDGLQSFAQQLINSPPQQRVELLAAHPEMITVALRKELVRRGNIRFANQNYGPALDIYILAEKISEQIKDQEGIAEASLNIGSVFYFQGQFDWALDNYRRAQQLFASLGNRSAAARSLVGIALTLQAQWKPRQALANFELALKEFEALNDQTEIANTLASIGSLQYDQGQYDAATKTLLRLSKLRDDGGNLLRIAAAFYMQKDYVQALAYYEQALDYANKFVKPAEAISALTGAANCYYNQRDYDRALEFYKRSLDLSEQLNDKAGAATQLQNIGNVHRARGDYGSALQSYFKSLDAAAAAGTKATVANTLGSIGVVRSLQGDNVQALEYFDKSLKEFQASGDQIGMARLFSYIGNAQFLQGQYELALAAYQKGLELHRSHGNKLSQADLLLGIGTVYVTQQKYAPALESYQQALMIYESSGRKAETAETLTKIAAAYRLQDQHAKGLEFATKALGLVQSTDLPAIRLLVLTELGRLQRGLDRDGEALSAFNEAIRIHQALRADAASADFEMQKDAVLPYLGAMEVLVDQGNGVEAFARAQDAKSEVLREIIHRGNFSITKDMTAAEVKEEIKLLGDLRSVILQLSSVQETRPNDALRIKALSDRVTAARTAHQSFRKLLYAKHPQIALYRGEVPPLNLGQLRPLLRRDTAILEYVVSEEGVYLFVLTNDTANVTGRSRTRSPRDSKAAMVKAYLLPVKPAEINQLAARFLQLIAAKDQSSSQTANDLYHLLLKPAEEQFVSKSRLIIIPDGVLWDVPFAALQPSPDQYLVDQKTLSYAISASTFTEMRKRRRARTTRRSGPTTVLAFADPVLNDDVVQRLRTTYRDLQLPQTATQLDQLRSIYGNSRSQFYTGGSAKKARARSDASIHNLLHFQTRAFLDQSVPFYSFVMLSSDPESSDDGLLRLWEVTNLNSKARVVVLPISNIAQARSQYANGLIAMSWAWFVAGTPTVVLSRWEADASSITEFSSGLHRNLRSQSNQTDNAQILRQSMLKLRQSKSRSPYNWAGFMLIGEP